MKFIEAVCPSCGASLDVEDNAKKVKCEYCESTFFIDDEGLFDKPKEEPRMGPYPESEKPASEPKKANVSPYRLEQCINPSSSQKDGISPKPKKRKTWLWVLGWIFIFPVPLTVLVVRSEKLKQGLKIAIICVAWVFYLFLGFSGNASNSTTTTTSNASKPPAKEQKAAKSTYHATSDIASLLRINQ